MHICCLPLVSGAVLTPKPYGKGEGEGEGESIDVSPCFVRALDLNVHHGHAVGRNLPMAGNRAALLLPLELQGPAARQLTAGAAQLQLALQAAPAHGW